MSVNGVRQLRKLVINYNTTAGGSAGLREYMSQNLFNFAKANPQIDILAKPIHLRGTANVTASWLNGRRETIPLANLDAREVSRKLRRLRDRAGGDERDRRFANPKSKCPSIQGKWQLDMNVTNDLTKPDLVINGKYNTPPRNPLDLEITLVSDGLPHPNTGKDWVELGEESMKHLAKHKVEKAARLKLEAEEIEWAKKNPELAIEKHKKLMIEHKSITSKQAAIDEAEKKKAKAAAAAPAKGKK